MRLLLEVASVETSRGVLPSVSLLVFWGEISAKKQGTRKGHKKGHRGLGAAVNGWRVGNAGDTIAVVIISGLPYLCHGCGGRLDSEKAAAATNIKLQKYRFFFIPANLESKIRVRLEQDGNERLPGCRLALFLEAFR